MCGSNFYESDVIWSIKSYREILPVPQCMSYENIVYLVKMEYVFEIIITGLEIMIKSAL